MVSMDSSWSTAEVLDLFLLLWIRGWLPQPGGSVL